MRAAVFPGGPQEPRRGVESQTFHVEHAQLGDIGHFSSLLIDGHQMVAPAASVGDGVHCPIFRIDGDIIDIGDIDISHESGDDQVIGIRAEAIFNHPAGNRV